jgi:hypothetical protein
MEKTLARDDVLEETPLFGGAAGLALGVATSFFSFNTMVRILGHNAGVTAGFVPIIGGAIGGYLGARHLVNEYYGDIPAHPRIRLDDPSAPGTPRALPMSAFYLRDDVTVAEVRPSDATREELASPLAPAKFVTDDPQGHLNEPEFRTAEAAIASARKQLVRGSGALGVFELAGSSFKVLPLVELGFGKARTSDDNRVFVRNPSLVALVTEGAEYVR